jgi:hypothetical protein
MCNALVYMAVWMCYAARTAVDRVVTAVPAIAAFVASGLIPGTAVPQPVRNLSMLAALFWLLRSSIMTHEHQKRTAADREPALDPGERERIQKKQGGHHYPPRPEDGPPMDDTDRNTDKIIKPSRLPKPE